MNRVLQATILLSMAGVIVAAWLTPPPQSLLGDVSRIFYFHVPAAWVTTLAYLVAMVYSVIYLAKRNLTYDQKASSAAELGTVFCILTTVSGAIFGRMAWGSFWNWDPRQVSILVLLLIYGAYFALRGAIQDEDRRAMLSSVYAIVAAAPMIFLVFIMPRVTQSLHPEDTFARSSSGGMSPTVSALFLISLSVFTIIFFQMHSLRSRIAGMERDRILSD